MRMAAILVVDDNAANLDLMLYLLRAFGHQAEGRSNGIVGLEAARTGAFAAVLCDILMPGIDGYEFAKEFKNDARLRATPLIAVTALAMAGDRERIAQAGFDGYIGKPIEPEAFATQIAGFLAKET
jgi:CheY-like chemotaxis protein